MKKSVYLFAGCLLTLSLSSWKSHNNGTPLSLIAKSFTESKVVADFDLDELMKKFSEKQGIPFQLDSQKIENYKNVETTSPLTRLEIQYLTKNLFENNLTKIGMNAVGAFLEIDSIKQIGEYEDYLKTIDIAMIWDAKANSVCRIKLSKNYSVLLWTISYMSFEACPFSYGDVFFGSFFVKDKTQNTALLGEYSGAGDAPFWFTKSVYAFIDAEQIKITSTQRNGGEYTDEDEEIIVESTEFFEMNYDENGFIKINN